MFTFEEREKSQFWLIFEAPFSENDEEAYMASLLRLSAQETPFDVVAVFGGHTPLSDENRKRQNLWFKENKIQIATYCKTLVRVSASYEEEGQDTSNFAKAVPFPVFNVKTQEAATRCLNEKLD